MNSASTSLTLEPTVHWQSTAEVAAIERARAVDGTAANANTLPQSWQRTARRITRPWHHRVGVFAAVISLQVGLVWAIIHAGFVKLPAMPQAITLIDVHDTPTIIKAPPPTMPEIAAIVPIELPVTITVVSETAITVDPPKPTATVTPPANAGSNADTVKQYQMALLRHLNSFKRYPAAARSGHMQGVAGVRFTMDRSGRVLSAALVSSSHFAPLDEEGVELLHRASPLPAPPPEVHGDPIEIVVPVDFSLH